MGAARGERGSVSVLTAAVLVAVAILVLAGADVWKVLSASARAQTAADAAALAAAQEQVAPAGTDPTSSARAYASVNGATLVSCACPPDGTTATVTVSVRSGPLFVLGAERTVTRTAAATSGGGT